MNRRKFLSMAIQGAVAAIAAPSLLVAETMSVGDNVITLENLRNMIRVLHANKATPITYLAPISGFVFINSYLEENGNFSGVGSLEMPCRFIENKNE
jgi:hypothetical protein